MRLYPYFVSMAFVLAGALAYPTHGHAINFDKLAGQGTLPQEQQAVMAQVAPNVVATKASNLPNVIGGTRYLQAAVTSGSIVTASVAAGEIDHSQGASTRGSTLIAWNGNSNDLQVPGLGSLDLTSDGATGFKITVSSFDFAGSQPLPLTFQIADATSTAANPKISTGTIALDHFINSSETFIIPFSSMTGTANIKTVGTITFLIDGTGSSAYDISLGFIGTNGRCDHIPTNGLIVDQCGICNGNNTTCADCEGTPNGSKVAGTSCSTGKIGACGEGTYAGKYPNCSCTQINTPAPEVCDQIDNDCDSLVDELLGKGDKCSVGVGACGKNGIKQCGTNGAVVCSVQPGTPTDEICDGIDNDCDGQIDEGSPAKGPKVDQCGVCNGDGKSCLDCTGALKGTAKVDSCGVCQGDDTSCITCKSVDITDILNALDGGAKQQERLIIRAAGILRSLPNSKRYAVEISRALGTAHKLQLRNWILAWKLPQISTTCQTTSVLCTTVSNTSILKEYRQNNVTLKSLGISMVNRIKAIKSGRINTKEKQLVVLMQKQFQDNFSLSQTVPEANFACTTPPGK